MSLLLSGLRAALVCAVGLNALPALADAIEDYSHLRTAASLDDACRYLKFVERKVIDEVAYDYIRTTTQFAHWGDGRMSREAYFAWLDGIDAAADAKAIEIGCTAAAEPYLLDARGRASATIMQRLLLAFHFSSLAETETYHRLITPDQLAGVQGYDGFLQQVYGQNYPAFHQTQVQAAGNLLPPAPTCSEEDALFGLCESAAYMFPDPEVSAKTGEAYADGRQALEDVHFEVAAESTGYRVWAHIVQKYWLAGSLIDGRTGSTYATLLDGDRSYTLDTDEEVYGAVAEMPDGRLRFMSYGTVAGEKLRGGIVRLYVRTGDKPEGLADWEIFTLADFYDRATAFDGVLLDEACLGGPCWEFPPEAMAAILATGFEETAELWLSADTGAVPSTTKAYYMRNGFSPQLMRRMKGETPPAAE